jgi:hypothetical protein
MTKQKALHKYANLQHLVNYGDLPAILPTKQSLTQFWADVKNLSWPEYYGASPWSLATQVAYMVCNNCPVREIDGPERLSLHDTIEYYHGT